MSKKNYESLKIIGKEKINNGILLFLTFIFIMTYLTINTYNIFAKVNILLNFLMLILLSFNNLKVKHIKSIRFALTYLIILLSFCAVFANNSNLGEILVITNFTILLFVSRYIDLSERIIKRISRFYLILLIFWMVIRPEGFNPNTVGLVSAYSYIGGSFYINNISNKITRVIGVFITTYMAIHIAYFSNSRSFLTCIIIFILLNYVLPVRVWRRKTFYRLMGIMITFGSIAYSLFYIYTWRNGLSFSIPFTKKNYYSGRELIWSELWNAFKHHYLFGLGTNYDMVSLPMNSLNVHNSMYHILVINGVIVFLLVVILFLANIYPVRKNIVKKSNVKVAAAGIIAISIQSFFEVSLIMPNEMPFILLLFIIINQKEKNSLNEIK